MQRIWAAHALGRGLALGGLSGLGRPGLDFAPAYFAGVLGLAHQSMAAPSHGTALWVALGWGLGFGVTSSIGAFS